MFIRMSEKYQEIKVSVIEEIACRNKWITRKQVLSWLNGMKKVSMKRIYMNS